MEHKDQPIAISNEEFLEILIKLQKFHGLFYQLWTLGKPVFTKTIPTAAVAFNAAGGCVDFIFNPDFWQTLSENQKLFVICHECLHVALNQGLRAVNGGFTNEANMAADIVVNHSLVNNFGFNRKEIDPQDIYCWIDTVFKDNHQSIKQNESFEYYHSMIKSQKIKTQGSQLVDNHSGFEDFSDVLKEVGDKLSEEEKEQIKDLIGKNSENMPAGKGSGGMEYLVPKIKVIKKKKWETVIKKWSLKYLKESTKDHEQWARINRRFVMLDNEFFIPSDMEMDEVTDEKHKINVWFFSDTSGSCSGFMTRFFQAAASLPTDRFDVKMHCFDTRVYETTLESRKLYGFGGTTFTCIEDYIQKYTKKHNIPYPKAIFVVTDGFGDVVKPEKPKNWFWFLSHSYKSCIPKESKIFMLKDFE